MEREVFMMANEEKMEQKQEGRKHNLKVFVIMIPLLIVSLLGLIVFSRENFKESVKNLCFEIRIGINTAVIS